MKAARRATAHINRENRQHAVETVLWLIVSLMVFATPLVIAPEGKDLFRIPKDLLFQGGWIALVTLLIVGRIHGHRLWRPDDLRNPGVWIALVAVLWTLIGTVASSNPRMSVASLLVVSGSAIFFLVSLKLLPGRSIRAVFLVMIPALLNAIVAAIQEWTRWRPIELEELEYDRHLNTTGLMGNPNDVGTLLVGPILLALACLLAIRGRMRFPMTIVMLILITGLLASGTLTALVATAVGVLVMTAVVSWRKAAVGAATLFVIALLTLTLYKPMAERAQRLGDLVASGDYNALITNRLTSFRAAEKMFREHPITGIGPGTFGWHYYDYKLLIQEQYPALSLSEKGARWSFNFGEVHNDHLEIAAEAGLPAWLLYMAALTYLGTRTFVKPASGGRDARHSVARLLALPLAIAFAVLTLAQFPLQLAATRTMFLFIAAISISWRAPDGD